MVSEPLRIAPVREHGVAVGPAQDTLRTHVTEVAACGHAGTDHRDVGTFRHLRR